MGGAVKIRLSRWIWSYNPLIASDTNVENTFINVVFVILVDSVLHTDIIVLEKPGFDTF